MPEKPSVNLTLPWPPSVNHYWRSVNNRVLISAKGRAYRTAVGEHVLQQRLEQGCYGTLDGRLAVDIRAICPDRRRRDLDNLLKAVLDALQYAAVYEDDSQIDALTIGRADLVEKPGSLYVTIKQEGE